LSPTAEFIVGVAPVLGVSPALGVWPGVAATLPDWPAALGWVGPDPASDVLMDFSIWVMRAVHGPA
jgi:hypothetical protein